MNVFFFISIWILKNVLVSGCALYPVKITCFEKLKWTDSKEVVKISTINEAWAKGWPDFRKNNINKLTRGRKSRFKSLIIEKDFEPENPKQLEELNENSCKWPIGHPNEKSFYFCGRSSLKNFSYCKLHLLYGYQPKGKKEEVADKDEIPEFIEKKIKSA